MIKKLHEEWEKLSQEARQVGDQDPRRQQEILERMSAVGGALRKMSQGAVTRTTLSQAVRDALGEILKTERDSFFPDLGAFQSEMAALRQSLDRTLAEVRERSEKAGSQNAGNGVAEGVNRLDARLKGLETSLAARLEGLEGRISQEVGSSDSASSAGLWGIIRRLDQRVDRLKAEVSQEIERSTTRSASRLEARLAAAEGRLTQDSAKASALAEGLKALESSLLARETAASPIDASRVEALEKVVGAAGTRLLAAQEEIERLRAGLDLAMREAIPERTARLTMPLEARLQTLEGRLDGDGGGLPDLTSRIEALSRDLHGVRDLAGGIESRLSGRIDESMGRAQGLSGELERKLEGLAGELHGRANHLERELNGLRERDGRLEAEVQGLRDLAGGLESRLSGRIDESMGLTQGLSGDLQRKLEGFAGDVHGRANHLLDELNALREKDGRLEADLQGLRDITGELEGRLSGRLDESIGRVQDLSGEVERKLDGLAGDLHGRANRLEGELNGLRERDGRLEAEVQGLRDLAGGLERNLRERLEPAVGDLAARTTDLRSVLDGQTARLAAIGQDLASADDHLAEGLKDLESRLSGRASDLESAAAARLEALEGDLRQSLAAAETRLGEAQGQLETRFTGSLQNMASRVSRELSERILRVEAALPEIGEIQERLQKQMGIVMDQLEEKMDGLVNMVGQIQNGLPPRELIEGLDDRLMKMETRFRTVSDQIDGLEESMPEVKALAEQLSEVRGDVATVAGEIATSEKELREIWDRFGRRVQDLQDLLRAGVDRWEADRSGARQRLVDLRDTLRDGIHTAAQHTGGGSSSFWGKMLARPEGGLRLEAEEWDRLRTRLESIVQGLDGILTENR